MDFASLKNSKIVRKVVDPIRNPLVQNVLETNFQKNYSKTLKVMQADITKILTNRKNGR